MNRSKPRESRPADPNSQIPAHVIVEPARTLSPRPPDGTVRTLRRTLSIKVRRRPVGPVDARPRDAQADAAVAVPVRSMEAGPGAAPAAETVPQRALTVLGIVVLAFNLRPAAVSVGPVLEEITRGLDLSAAQAGLLTTLPVLCFTSVGALATRLAGRFGLHRVSLAGLVLVSVALGLRVTVTSPWLFLALSFVALSGAALANVLLPSLVKLHFPRRIGLMTAVYSTAMAVGLTSASVLTVPIAQSGGALSWQRGLSAWAVIALVAAIPWVGLVRHDRSEQAGAGGYRLADVARTRLGWLMAIFFGLQSLQAYSIFGWFALLYRDAGFDASTAGLLLGVITGVSIPLSFVIPYVAAKVRDQRWLLTAIMACYPLGYLGLIFAPAAGAWLWAVCLGIASCAFPLILTLIGLRARTPGGTAALSGFTQSVGYLISAAGPFGVGILHGATGGWAVPLWVLLSISVPQYLAGLALARPAYVEDELATRSPAPADVFCDPPVARA